MAALGTRAVSCHKRATKRTHCYNEKTQGFEENIKRCKKDAAYNQTSETGNKNQTVTGPDCETPGWSCNTPFEDELRPIADNLEATEQDTDSRQKDIPCTLQESGLQVPIEAKSFGTVVWGRFSRKKWWPGIIIDGALTGQSPPKQGWTWVMWFGDFKISQLPLSKVEWFGLKFKDRATNLCTLADQGVTQALQVCAKRLGVQLDGPDSVRAWVQDSHGFCSLLQSKHGEADPLGPKTGEEYPECVLSTLQDFWGVRSLRSERASHNNTKEPCPIITKYGQPDPTEGDQIDNPGQRPKETTGQRPKEITGQCQNKSTGQHQKEPTGQHQKEPTGQHQKEPTGQHQKEPTGQHQKEPTGQHQKEPTGQHSKEITGQHQKEHAGQHPKGPTELDHAESDQENLDGGNTAETDDEEASTFREKELPAVKASSFGSVIWGRFSRKKWWPGIIIDGALAGQPPPKQGWTWLMWFGDFKISQLPLSKVEWFGLKFKGRAANLCKLADQGVTQALQVCATRLGVQLDGPDSLRTWARDPHGFHCLLQPKHGQADPLTPKIGEEYPECVLSTLQDFWGVRSLRSERASHNNTKEPCPIIIKYGQQDPTEQDQTDNTGQRPNETTRQQQKYLTDHCHKDPTIQHQEEPTCTGQYQKEPTGQYQKEPTGQYQKEPTGQCQKEPTGQYQKEPTGQCQKEPTGQCQKGPTELDHAESDQENLDGGNTAETDDEETSTFRKKELPAVKASSFGSVVWGRFFRKKWWPGIIIDGALAGQPPPKQGWTWLMWFGDFKISQLPLSKVEWFGLKFKGRAANLCKLADQGVTQTLQVCATRLGVQLDGPDSVRAWARDPDGFCCLLQPKHGQADPLAPKNGDEYPDLVLRTLQDLFWGVRSVRTTRCEPELSADPFGQMWNKLHKSNISERNDDLTSQSETAAQIAEKNKDIIEDAWALLKRTQCDPETSSPTNCEAIEIDTCSLGETGTCLACTKTVGNATGEHPLFEAIICPPCKEEIMESMFAVDGDGSFVYCCICAQHGEMLICEAKDCGRSYCMSCLARCLSKDTLTQLQGLPESDSWACFLCSKYSSQTHGILKPHPDWQEHVVMLFNPHEIGNMECRKLSRKGKKRGMRVLSLADGIGAIKVALDHLGIEVEVYYTAEINLKAATISVWKNDQIHCIKNLLNIDEAMLQEIGPIDLVVAAPPVPTVEEPVVASRELLLKKSILIIKQLQAVTSDSGDLYWLLEIPTTVQKQIRKEVSHVLQMEPVMWNSQFFSPVLLPKLYWGNIPGLNSAPLYFSQHGNQTDLDKYLVNDQYFKRKALVSHVRPRVLIGLPPDDVLDERFGYQELYSPEYFAEGLDGEPMPDVEVDLYQDVEDPYHFQLPVLWNDYNSEIFTEEMERLMGFPESYTDLDSEKGVRLQLLANSSSVLVLKHLLTPLADRFASVKSETIIPFWKTRRLHFLYSSCSNN